MTRYRYRARWFAAAWVAPVLVMILPVLVPGTEPAVVAPLALFWLVLIAASSCVLTSVWLLGVAHRQDLAEVGIAGLWFTVLSILPLVHGLTTPGVLYESNHAFTGSVFLAGPIAAGAALPTLFRRTRWASVVARNWRTWVAIWLSGTVTVAIALLIEPDLVTPPAMGTGLAIGAASPPVALAMMYSWRHLTMAAVSGSRRYMIVFVGFVFTGVSQLVWVTSVAFGPTFWFAHFFDIMGVFAGTVGGAIVYLRAGRPSSLVGPIVEADPLVALDLALDPSVGAFIADLEAKDEVTRDHVLRTAEAAMQVAVALRLDPAAVRDTGIGAVLHDIGKIGIPDAVLNKPGRLEPTEYELMKSHPVVGAELLAANPALRSVAAVVRAHHERIDGHGYPDGLRGDEIPMPARIVAVCDAYDAMAHDRPYRSGMGLSKALAVLREHAGTQWDHRAVTAFARLAEGGRVRTAPTTLAHVGHDPDRVHRSAIELGNDAACGCLAAVPDTVAEELLAIWSRPASSTSSPG